MSDKTTVLDFGQLQIGDGATPTEVFVTSCGVVNIEISKTTATTEQSLRDCTKQNAPATIRTRVSSTSWAATFSGIAHKDNILPLETAYSTNKNFKILASNDDSTDNGKLHATWAGNGIMTDLVWSLAQEGEGGQFNATIKGTGALPVTLAP
jgi:hypothetical protein